MQRRIESLAALFVMVVSSMVALAAPAAAATNQISGVAFYATGSVCQPSPVGYTEVPPTVMTGDLQGCWYTKIVTSKDNGIPSGVYQERGQEIFVGTLDGGDLGTFRTTYHFTSKWDPELTGGSEVHGRCQHPIVAGSGTGAFAGVTGRVDFKDDVATGCFLYRGHLSFP
jgi:hypothetical protein